MDIPKIIEKTKQVSANVERGYTQSVYGTQLAVHKQMESDIYTLLDSVSAILTELIEEQKRAIEIDLELINILKSK